MLTAAAMVMISVAWHPYLQERMVVPSDPNHPMTSRLMTGFFANLLKAVFTVGWMAVLVKSADEYSMQSLGDGFVAMSDSDLWVDFIVHILSSHFGYHAARIACAMSIQPMAFGLPLVLATPLTLAIVMSSCNAEESEITRLFIVNCLQDPTDKYLLIGIAIVLWLSQNIIVARNTWNARSPLLALDETLFFQASYNSVLLEQYISLNRRPPDVLTEMIDEDPDDPSVRVYVCSTMYRESPTEMKQLIKSILKLDASVRNVFESHVWMDGGCSGNTLGQYAVQFVACLREEVEALGTIDIDTWIESGQKMETPYGQRIEWLLPEGTPMAVHLKDPALVKAKKRWSQVMYMYYLLQFRVPREHPRDTSASYILTTDADIIFRPEGTNCRNTAIV